MSPTYPKRFECDVVLADGGTAHVRPVRPDDGPRIESFHARLSRESVQMRFFSTMPVLKPWLLKRFLNVDYRDSIVLLTLVGERVIAMAMYAVRAQQPDHAEVAFAVEDAHHGRGIGTLLLEHLAAIARENGIRGFTADTLPQNRKMLQVFRDAGMTTRRTRERGVVHVTIPIEPDPQLVQAIEVREHRGEAVSVSRLLNPRSVAVIATPSAEDRARALSERLERSGFSGSCATVHLNEASTDLDGVELALSPAPASQARQLVEACAEHQVHGLVLCGESGDADGDPDLVHFARAHGVRLLGPGSLGLANTDPAVRLDAVAVEEPLRPGSLGIACDDPEAARATLAAVQRLGVGVSAFAALGDRRELSVNDLLQYFEEDERTRAVGLCIDTLGNARKLSRIARRVAARKPVRVLLGEGLPRGPALDAFLAQSGLTRVEDLEALLAPTANTPAAEFAGPPTLAGCDLRQARSLVSEALAGDGPDSELEGEAGARLLSCVGVEPSGDLSRDGLAIELRPEPDLDSMLYVIAGDRRGSPGVLPLEPRVAARLAREATTEGAAGLEELLLRIARLAESLPELVELRLGLNHRDGTWTTTEPRARLVRERTLDARHL